MRLKELRGLVGDDSLSVEYSVRTRGMHSMDAWAQIEFEFTIRSVADLPYYFGRVTKTVSRDAMEFEGFSDRSEYVLYSKVIDEMREMMFDGIFGAFNARAELLKEIESPSIL